MDKSLFLTGFIFIQLVSFSQKDLSPATWRHIDTSITINKNLRDISDLVQRLKATAWQEGKYFQVARSYYYQILIADKLTEDTFYFRNSAFIDSLLLTQGLPKELQLSMHLLKAKRLNAFTTKYLKFNRQRYEKRGMHALKDNYAGFSNELLDDIASTHYDKAKQLARELGNVNMEDVLWLSSDQLVFLFNPDLFDIIIAEQIGSYKKKNYYSFPDSLRKTIGMHLSQDDFISEVDTMSVKYERYFGQIKYYKEWLDYQGPNALAYYFIETLTRKFLYEILNQGSSTDSPLQKQYEKYLINISSSKFNTARAYGVYQLCLLWNQQAKKYFPYSEEGGSRYIYNVSRQEFDTVYRYHPVKALQLFEQNKQMLDSFVYLRNILQIMERQIKESEVDIQMQRNNLPVEPILAELSYKNANRIYYKIVRASSDNTPSSQPGDAFLKRLMSFEKIREDVILLPATDDYNKHSSYVKLDGLPTGNYYLLFSHKELLDSNRQIETVNFRVSSIAVIENGKRVYLLDRKTGMPLVGAKIDGKYMRDSGDTLGKKPIVTKRFVSNQQGFVEIHDSKIRALEIFYRADTAYETVDITGTEDDAPDDVYSKEEYDDLVEFYEENAEAHVFTDRSIYRPGQTVYYKVIFLTKNKLTGEQMVMSKQNLGGSLFKKIYKQWLKESEPYLSVSDPFGKEMDSIQFKLNDYGSFSGEYKLPKTAATGEWDITPDYVETGDNAGSFKVEEYKRPSYEISIEKPKKLLFPGDSIVYKVKVKSFAGASLSNVQIKYTIDRSGSLPIKIDGENSYHNEELFDTTGYTNSEGELEIIIVDSLLRKYNFSSERSWDFHYSLDVEAIDETGESYKEDDRLTINSQPVNIRFPAADKFNRTDANNLSITAANVNAGNISKTISVKISRLIKENKLYANRDLRKVDQWIYSKAELQQLFPHLDFDNKEDAATRQFVLEKTISTGANEKLKLDESLFTAGEYLMEAVCIENGKLIGKSEKRFSIFDEKKKELPAKVWSFLHVPHNSVTAGDTLKVYNGNSELPAYVIHQVKYFSFKRKLTVVEYYQSATQEAGLNVWKWKVPADAVDHILLTQTFVLNNEVFREEEKIYVDNRSLANPEIIVEKYRKKLAPGSKETFSVSIKTNKDDVAAELMTAMYDVSLDKLEPHKWNVPSKRHNRYLSNEWTYAINTFSSNNKIYAGFYETDDKTKSLLDVPLWWINPVDYDGMWDWSLPEKRRVGSLQAGNVNFYRRPNFGATSYDVDDMNPYIGNGFLQLQGRVPGVSLSSTAGLSEVVVVGYGTLGTAKKDVSYSFVTIRGATSLTSYSQPLIILDGVPFEGDLSKIDPATITAGLVLKGADASSIYGSRAANGVLVLSTKGEIVFPVVAEEPVMPPRKNFNETAFFFPNIYADRNGYYNFTFTMPETVTEWSWKLLAHTKKAQFAYAERKLNTQLPLMVQPNMPRLLYQGDKIILQSRITNLDTIDANGKITCKIEDAVTGEDISAKLLQVVQNSFSVAKKSNASSAFEINVPLTLMNPLKIIISVRSGSFSDAEEHTIPVLSPKVFVRQAQPFYFLQRDTVIQTAPLPADAESFGMGLFVLPKPQAALINSLPYLAEYSFDCAEQLTNKILACLTATKIMRTDSLAQQSFVAAKKAVEKTESKEQQLPDELSENAMPWLNLSSQTQTQQEKLFRLLDSSKTEDAIKQHLDKLYKLQNSDGGLSWFSGGRSNSYISQYVLGSFGQMKKDGLLVRTSIFENSFKTFVEKLIAYCDGEKVESYQALQNIRSRTNWISDYPFSVTAMSKIDSILKVEWRNADRRSLSGKALLIIATLKTAGTIDSLYRNAILLLRSIRQQAIEDEANGIRWKNIADADDLNNSTEESVALLAEAFELAGTDASVSKGIIRWLLTTRTEHSWSSTKATAAVVSLLSKQQKNVTGVSTDVTASIGKVSVSATNDLLNGSSNSFVANTTMSTQVSLISKTNIAASGNLIWYYFTSNPVADNSTTGVSVKKTLSRFNEATKAWEAINESSSLKMADVVKVSLVIESPKALQYVFVDDKRAAGLEPVNNTSGYEYASSFGYYKSIRDAGVQLFIDYIPSGKHEISYEVKVSQEGKFTNGPASLQCMYRPEVSAYSNSLKLQTVK